MKENGYLKKEYLQRKLEKKQRNTKFLYLMTYFQRMS